MNLCHTRIMLKFLYAILLVNNIVKVLKFIFNGMNYDWFFKVSCLLIVFLVLILINYFFNSHQISTVPIIITLGIFHQNFKNHVKAFFYH